jgi:hypothetical protein
VAKLEAKQQEAERIRRESGRRFGHGFIGLSLAGLTIKGLIV